MVYKVFRSTTGEQVAKFDTEAKAEKYKREKEAQEAQLVESGWISKPATYLVMEVYR